MSIASKEGPVDRPGLPLCIGLSHACLLTPAHTSGHAHTWGSTWSPLPAHTCPHTRTHTYLGATHACSPLPTQVVTHIHGGPPGHSVPRLLSLFQGIKVRALPGKHDQDQAGATRKLTKKVGGGGGRVTGLCVWL